MKQHSIRKHVSELFEEGTADVMVKNARLSSAEQQIVTQERAKMSGYGQHSRTNKYARREYRQLHDRRKRVQQIVLTTLFLQTFSGFGGDLVGADTTI